MRASNHNELLLDLYRIAHEQAPETFHDAALELLKTVLPFDSSMWGSAQLLAPGRGMDIHTLHLHQSDPQMIVDYGSLMSQDSAAASLFGQHRATEGFHAQSWFQAPQEQDLLAFLRRYGHNNYFISLNTHPETRFSHWVSLFRANPDAHCQAHEKQLLSELTPHLLQALAMNRALYQARLLPHEGAVHGAAMADPRGMIYQADPLFQQMLRQEWPGWRGHTLPEAALQQFRQGQPQHTGACIAIRCHVAHGLLFLKTRWRSAADMLTPRELTVAQLVAQGLTHKQIAANLSRAPATVRNQIQSIYQKLEISNVAALIDALRQLE